MPTHPAEGVDARTDSALERMTKRSIRHYPNDDSFCLTHDERTRLNDRLTQLEQQDRAFQSELADLVAKTAEQGELHNALIADAIERARRLLESVLLTLGERFASAVRSGQTGPLGLETVREMVPKDVAERAPQTKDASAFVAVVSQSIAQIITEAGPASRSYLRRLADSYTLFAFLREMPDVQAALVKMFSHGEIWLDTSLILPLMAEELIDDVNNRRFTAMLKAAVDSGLTLRITGGVLEEVERHMNVSLACLRTVSQWRSRTPFLLAAYLTSGRASKTFSGWLQQFAGHERPLDDIAEYLREEHSIELGSLEADANRLSDELRHALQEIWNTIHEHRRPGAEADPLMVQRLAQHDVENYGGVINKRRQERDSALGYSTWWLTLDRGAFEVSAELEKRLGSRPPDPPVMSADFLVNYLAFGPFRARVAAVEKQLPVMVDLRAAELPAELLEVADNMRAQLEGQNERLIRRRVRDELDRAKMRRGFIAGGGGDQMQRDVEARIQKNPQRN